MRVLFLVFRFSCLGRIAHGLVAYGVLASKEIYAGSKVQPNTKYKTRKTNVPRRLETSLPSLPLRAAEKPACPLADVHILEGSCCKEFRVHLNKLLS